MQVTMPYKISQTHLYLQDEVINLDDLTELENGTIFTLEESPIRSYEFAKFHNFVIP